MMKTRKVMIFGTFDDLHPGHLHFIKSASKLGDELTVCLSRDSIVEKLKGKSAEKNEIKRQEELEELPEVDLAMLGDEELGEYQCVVEVNPDIIAVGYDQTELKEDLSAWIVKNQLDIKLTTIDSHQPEKYKSSILRQ